MVNHTFQSGGRLSNWEPCCAYPACSYWQKDGLNFYGWCQHPENRVFTDDNPGGFQPSVAGNGYCNFHTPEVTQ